MEAQRMMDWCEGRKIMLREEDKMNFWERR